MKNILEYIPFILLTKFAQLIGYKNLTYPARILTYLFYNLLKIRKDVVFKNLSIAFPEKSKEELELISHSCYLHFSKLILEMMCIPRMNLVTLRNLVYCKEVESLKKEYEKGNGLVILTAHLGNWEYGAISVPAQMGTIMHPIVKPQRNPYVTKWLNMMRETHGNKVIPLGISIRKIYEVIKNGKLLGVVGDQRGPKEGRKVKLFGRETSIFSGTAELVSKSLTPLYVLFAVRTGENYRAFTEKIELSDLPKEQEARVNQINQRFADLLEKYVRQYPEQWFWMHNIWKY